MKTEGKEAVTLAISEAKNIGLMGHKRGDGDSFGSLIGLKIGLEKLGKETKIFSEIGLPADLEFLYSYINFKFYSEYQSEVDLLIVIDSSDSGVASFPQMIDQYRKNQVKIVQIDHHQLGSLSREADVVWADPNYSSVAEMGYYLLKDLNIEFDRSIATALLTGINTDTSSFQNQNTSGLSLEISSDLMLHGARLGFINKKIESATTINKLKLIGTAFNRLSFSTKYKTAVSYLTYKDFEETGMTGALSNSEVVNTLNQIKGAKMVMFIAEQEPGMIHVSFRTRDKDVDVAKIAQFLGGGGHVKAAGFTFEGKISDDGSGVKVIP